MASTTAVLSVPFQSNISIDGGYIINDGTWLVVLWSLVGQKLQLRPVDEAVAPKTKLLALLALQEVLAFDATGCAWFEDF